MNDQAHNPSPMRTSDYQQVLSLNEGALPAVNRINADTLQHLHSESACALVLRDGEVLCGFALLFDENANYASLNFQWFKRQYPEFLYMDRIVVAPAQAGRGHGRILYQSAASVAVGRGVPMCCEVNLEPPNPRSHSFHRRLGFRDVGEQSFEGGSKRVSMMLHDRPCTMLSS